MKKFNMKQAVASALKSNPSIKRVSTDYPSSWNDFPTAIYRTSDKPHAIDAQGNELQTFWTLTIELYGNKSLTSLATEVTDVFAKVGFTGSCKDANTADLKRIIIELSGVVDNMTNRVYQK